MIPRLGPRLVESWLARGLRLRAHEADANETLDASSDTESFGRLVRTAVQTLRPRTVLDVGCGCGIPTIEAAVAGSRQVYGIDLARANVLLARENVARAGLMDRIAVRRASWEYVHHAVPEAREVELLVANPPYVAGGIGATVDGGADGTRLLRAIIDRCPPNASGLALLFGSVSNPLAVIAHLEASGWSVERLQVHAVRFGRYTSRADTLRKLQTLRRTHRAFFCDLEPVRPDRAPHAYLVLGVVARRRVARGSLIPAVQQMLLGFQHAGLAGLAEARAPVPLDLGTYFDERAGPHEAGPPPSRLSARQPVVFRSSPTPPCGTLRPS